MFRSICERPPTCTVGSPSKISTDLPRYFGTTWTKSSLRSFALSSWLRRDKRTRLLFRRPARQLFDEVHFFLLVGFSIRPENLMEPHRRLAVRIGFFPRIPRQIRLGLSRHQSPVDRSHVEFLRYRQRSLER